MGGFLAAGAIGDMVGGAVNNSYQSGSAFSPEYLRQQIEDQKQNYALQVGLSSNLRNQVNGTGGPAPEQIQYLQNVQNNNQMAQGLIASRRGLNPALAARMGSNIQANSNQQAAMQSSLLGQQRQVSAQQQLQQLYGQMQQGSIAQQQLYNQADMAKQGTNASTAYGNQQARAGLLGGVLNGAGSATMMAASNGGMVPGYAQGGITMPMPSPMETQGGPTSIAGQYLMNMVKQQPMGMANGGALNFKPGGAVPGSAGVSGDSIKNDTVPAMLSPKEIVIPRSISMDKDAPEKAKQFVAAVLARGGFKNKK